MCGHEAKNDTTKRIGTGRRNLTTVEMYKAAQSRCQTTQFQTHVLEDRPQVQEEKTGSQQDSHPAYAHPIRLGMTSGALRTDARGSQRHRCRKAAKNDTRSRTQGLGRHAKKQPVFPARAEAYRIHIEPASRPQIYKRPIGRLTRSFLKGCALPRDVQVTHEATDGRSQTEGAESIDSKNSPTITTLSEKKLSDAISPPSKSTEQCNLTTTARLRSSKSRPRGHLKTDIRYVLQNALATQ